jgi:hypothetical protein
MTLALGKNRERGGEAYIVNTLHKAIGSDSDTFGLFRFFA